MSSMQWALEDLLLPTTKSMHKLYIGTSGILESFTPAVHECLHLSQLVSYNNNIIASFL